MNTRSFTKLKQQNSMTQTKQHHSDLLQLQTNAEETNTDNKNSPLIEKEQIPNTPFWIIGDKENGYHIIMGKYRLTNEPIFPEQDPLTDETYHIVYAARTWLKENQWNAILSIALIAITETPNIIKPN